MLINLSNHPSSAWSETQLREALKQFGCIYDLPFPAISPKAGTNRVNKLAAGYFQDILVLQFQSAEEVEVTDPALKAAGVGYHDLKEPFGVHLMGELTFCFALAARLQSHFIRCIVSTTARKAIEQDGMKLSQFNFVKFRDYPPLLNLD